VVTPTATGKAAAAAVAVATPAPALTHLDARGQARMVEVGAKPETLRVATARGEVRMAAATARLIGAGGLPKGDVLAVARLAGLQAVKHTHTLIPLCHPLRISGVDVDITLGRDRARIVATVRAFDRTGVEMEALTAVSVAALALYDMAKAVDRGMVIGPIELVEKRGGRSGTWRRSSRPASRR
jgi:cyclic pyranopterin phosphate synthase